MVPALPKFPLEPHLPPIIRDKIGRPYGALPVCALDDLRDEGVELIIAIIAATGDLDHTNDHTGLARPGLHPRQRAGGLLAVDHLRVADPQDISPH